MPSEGTWDVVLLRSGVQLPVAAACAGAAAATTFLMSPVMAHCAYGLQLGTESKAEGFLSGRMHFQEAGGQFSASCRLPHPWVTVTSSRGMAGGRAPGCSSGRTDELPRCAVQGRPPPRIPRSGASA